MTEKKKFNRWVGVAWCLGGILGGGALMWLVAGIQDALTQRILVAGCGALAGGALCGISQAWAQGNSRLAEYQGIEASLINRYNEVMKSRSRGADTNDEK
jgi:hypothetical protein